MADIINGNWYCKMSKNSHFEMPKFSNFKSSSSNNKSIVLPKIALNASRGGQLMYIKSFFRIRAIGGNGNGPMAG